MSPLQLWRAFLARLEALTARERAGIAAACAALTLVLAAGAFDWALRSGQAAQQAHDARIAAQAAFARESDPRFQEQVALATDRVWRWSLVEASPSLAQARALSEGDELLQQAGIANARTTLAEEPPLQEPPPLVRPLLLNVSGQFEWRTFLGLLSAMQESEHAFAPESVEVSSAADGQPEFSMQVRAPFLEDAPQ